MRRDKIRCSKNWDIKSLRLVSWELCFYSTDSYGLSLARMLNVKKITKDSVQDENYCVGTAQLALNVRATNI